ncbi:hypothetical protein M407DRAFT_186710 [Tulasnella calospora MUT 4182]|uniref:BTB domain-containing protein n=1 Tax=Tulasnella calospora MUT 4182 TaxID=1051891 RepID=A0A0C3QX93_9AGAM|nr:hypothetical protein M407DRAFT_186710 [Tulasnella calospora MUT 4182]
MPSQHPKYGDARYMVFLVEDVIFHIPNRRLMQSQFFREMIEGTHTGLELEGKDDEHPISLGGISAFEMTSFLDVTQSARLDDDSQLTFSQWTAALHLATMWGFGDIRERIIQQVDKTISEADPIDRIEASLKCRVKKWLHPAYVVLCKREIGLSDAEAERLGFRRSMAIWRVRESLRPIQSPNPVSVPVTRQTHSWSLPPPPPAVQHVNSGSSNGILSDAKAIGLITKEEALNFS